MPDPFYIFAVLAVIGIFYVSPILIIYFIYKVAKRKLNIKIANSILGLMIFIFLYLSYADFYPLENSYRRNFIEKTSLDFPKSAKYLEKIASNSIFDFGGRMYCSKIGINTEDYLKLKNAVENSKFTKTAYYTEDDDTAKIFAGVENGEIDKIYNLKSKFDEYFVIFLLDKKTLILFYRSW
jgi:hypothetical protein